MAPKTNRMLARLRYISATAILAAMVVLGVGSCGEDPTSLAPILSLAFSAPDLNLGTERSSTIEIRNTGNRAVGPIQLFASTIRDEGGNVVPGSQMTIDPTLVPTLNAGQAALVTIDITVGDLVQIGQYLGSVTAQAGLDAMTSVELSFAVAAEPTVDISALSITTTASSLRQGDVLQLETEALDEGGSPVADLPIQWSVSPAGSAFVDGTGRLVGYAPGTVTLTASYGTQNDSHTLTLTPRGLSGTATKVGTAAVTDRHTSDLWLHGNYAYTGTWGQRSASGSVLFGNELHAWDVSNPASPTRTQTLSLDARTVNDVKVSSDGALAVVTHEGSNDGLNGITILDLADPASPVVVSRYTSGLESGVHNVWIEGDYAYLVLDGNGNGMRVMDLRDPNSPKIVASFYAGSSFLHDVYVRDGIAFLSHWNAGLILVDVGSGVAGGSPTNPVEISRIGDLGGQTHNAWYWPETGYVFVGEEDFGTPGHMRLIDASDLSNPTVVGTFAVPGATPHNFWLDEANAVLYLAWYENGLRALDVSGVLLGELDRQGREIFGVQYDGTGTGCGSPSGTCSWAPQLHQGYVFVSDMNAGMVVLQPSF